LKEFISLEGGDNSHLKKQLASGLRRKTEIVIGIVLTPA
jgi:hypothetical protein